MLKEFRNIYDWPAPSDGCAIAMGRFDGVHLGHRALLERTVERARAQRIPPVCFSFQEHTYPGASERGLLTTSQEKVDLLDALGIEFLLHPGFEPPLIHLSADDFLHRLLINRWHARVIVVGYDFRFGKGRQGDAAFLTGRAGELGVDVEVLEPFALDGDIVKATLIRHLVSGGQIEKANRLLGRPYSVHVSPKPGRGLGKKIGFPTINFPWPDEKVMPPMGIYVVRIGSRILDPASAAFSILDGVANLGFQPTIDPQNKVPSLEVHILDPVPHHIESAGDLPADAAFEVAFLAFLRPEERFDSLDKLSAQIARDCIRAREILAASL